MKFNVLQLLFAGDKLGSRIAIVRVVLAYICRRKEGDLERKTTLVQQAKTQIVIKI